MFADQNSKQNGLLHNVLHCVTFIIQMKIVAVEWSDDDLEHIAHHGINPAEVEDICFNQHISIRGRFRRYVLYGQRDWLVEIMCNLRDYHNTWKYDKHMFLHHGLH